MSHAIRSWLASQRARLVAADPGLRGLRAAARVIGEVVLAFVVLPPALLALDRSPVAVAPGVVVVLLSQLAVTETTRRAHIVTTLLLPAAASASLLLASLLVSGSPSLQVGIVLVSLFLAFYLVSVSYTLMTFFITVMLGVLYEVLGRFSAHILEVRLAETVIGAATVMAAALLLLPTRTRTVVRDRRRRAPAGVA